MKYLLDTDHATILQRRAGGDYAKLAARIARQAPVDLALPIVGFHEQVGGALSLERFAIAWRTDQNSSGREPGTRTLACAAGLSSPCATRE